MKWFDILKRPMSQFVQRDLDPTVTIFDLDNLPPIHDAPPEQFRRKVTRRKRAVEALSPLRILDEEEECPPGELWCETHEECETEKVWLTHNKHLTPEEIENQKQFQSSGKFGPAGQFGGP